MRVFLSALIWIALLTAVMADPASARIAIVSDAASQDLAALVTSELSSGPNINLVERDDLAKVGDELKLQQLAGSDAVGLGKLLGADGLIFLSKAPDGVHARLTATGLGIVLFDLQLGTEIHPDELAKLLTSQIEDVAPKLKLSPSDAIPVSILNLRSEYATYASTKLERQLTLLLESRLSSVPKIVVLERRHAWAMNFERTLAPGAPTELLRGSYLLDGSLKMSSGDTGAIIASLRLQSPRNNTPVTLEIKGTTADLPGLADQMESAVVMAMGQTSAGAAPTSATEAHAYLEEGIWAWRNELSQPALEALDSAELLGETAPDLLAARIPVLCDLAAGPLEQAEFTPEDFRWAKTCQMPIDPHPEARIEDVLRAMDDATRYAKVNPKWPSEIPESPIPPLEPLGTVIAAETPADKVKSKVRFAASKVLWMLNQMHHSREEELRQALRAFAGFDPLHHQFPQTGIYAIEDAELWSESPDEVIAYYQSLASNLPRKLVESDRPINLLADRKFDEINRILLQEGPDKFCSRFTQVPSERRALFAQLIDKLIHDPSTQYMGLLARATWEAPAEKEADYEAFLDYLSSNRQSLVQSGDLGTYLTSAARLQQTLPKPTNPKFIDLLHYDIQNIESWQEGNYCHIWHPDLFPPGDAPALWNEFQACKARTLAYEKLHKSADGKITFRGDPAQLEPMFTQLENDYIAKFGRPSTAAAPAPITAGLTVARSWHSWQSAANPAMPFNLLGWAFDDHETVWVYGYHDPYGNHLVGDSTVPVTMFKIHLPDLQTQAITAPWRLTPVEQDSHVHIRFGPDDVYVYGVGDHLDRFKISTGQWERRDVTPDIAELFPVGEKLYFGIKYGNGLARYDWDSSQTIILADGRRRPAHNQFDDRTGYTVQDVFATPDGKICATIEEGNYLVQEQPIAWPAGPKFDIFPGYPPDRKTGVFWSWVQGRDFASTPTFPPFSKEWIWLRAAPDGGVDYGFRDRDVFALSGDGEFKLLWYQPYDPRPLSIPLDLKIDDEARRQMESTHASEFDQALAPATGGLRMAVSEQGICLFSSANSRATMPIFWFAPFADIDAYRQAHNADNRPAAAFNPLAGMPPEELKKMQDSIQKLRLNGVSTAIAPLTAAPSTNAPPNEAH